MGELGFEGADGEVLIIAGGQWHSFLAQSRHGKQAVACHLG